MHTSSDSMLALERMLQEHISALRMGREDSLFVEPGAIDALMAAVDSTGGLRRLITEVGEGDVIEGIARALTLTNRKDDRAREAEHFTKMVENLRHLRVLDRILDKLTEDLTPTIESLSDARRSLSTLFSKDLCVLRSSGAFGTPRVAEHIDDISISLGGLIGAFSGFLKAVHSFRRKTRENGIGVVEGQPIVEVQKRVDALSTNIHSILEVFDYVLEILKKYPEQVTKLVQGITKTRSQLIAMYADRHKEVDLGSATQARTRVPLYKNNPYLTALLDELTELIPDPQDGEQTAERVELTLEAVAFANNINTLGDAKLLAALTGTTFFPHIARVVTSLHRALLHIHAVVTDESLQAARQAGPSGKEGASLLSFVTAGAQVLSGKNGAFDAFQEGPLLEAISNLSPVLKPKTSVDGEHTVSEREAAYLAIFKKLEDLMRRVMRDPHFVKSGDFPAELKDLIILKGKLTGNERAQRKARVEVDIERGNHCFCATKVGQDDLILQRVPTYDVTFSDLIGKSWGRVVGMLDKLLEHADYGHLHSTLAPRGKAHNNLLIVGPYGCAKNEFLKALFSDPRLVGVNMTTDRLMSMWHGKDESNTRALFEQSQAISEEYERPVVIGWDEFDSNYEGHGGRIGFSNGVSEQRQKILQSILEGDTVYSGVCLIGLTNEPLKIPVPIYRRFWKVEVIDPLDADERVKLLNHFLRATPLEDGFESKTNWEEFRARTDFASGDVIGKVADAAYDGLVQRMKEQDAPALRKINSLVQERVRAGESLKPEDKLHLFRTHTSLTLSPADLQRAWNSVLGSTEIASAMEQQRLFYGRVHDLMRQAFKGHV